MQTLPSRALTVQRIRLLLLSALLFFVGGLLLYFFLWLGVAWLAASFLFSAAGLFFYLPAYCRSVSFTMEENTLLIQMGVFFRKTILIGRSKVQYIRLVITPVANLNHTASLIFFLAGQAVWLGELDRAQARRLQEEFAHET